MNVYGSCLLLRWGLGSLPYSDSLVPFPYSEGIFNLTYSFTR